MGGFRCPLFLSIKKSKLENKNIIGKEVNKTGHNIKVKPWAQSYFALYAVLLRSFLSPKSTAKSAVSLAKLKKCL